MCENGESFMKRIVATRLALIIGTTMIVISLLNFLIQRDDVIDHNIPLSEIKLFLSKE